MYVVPPDTVVENVEPLAASNHWNKLFILAGENGGVVAVGVLV